MMTTHALQPNSIVAPMSTEKRATTHAKKYRNANCFVSHSSPVKTWDEKRCCRGTAALATSERPDRPPSALAPGPVRDALGDADVAQANREEQEQVGLHVMLKLFERCLVHLQEQHRRHDAKHLNKLHIA